MKQKVIVVFIGTDNKVNDLQDEIEPYLIEGWKIAHTSTAFVERASVGNSIAITLLLGK